MMALLDVPFREIAVPLGSDGYNEVDPNYRKLNPRGQIPTLTDGVVRLWGSTAILVYVAGRYDPSETWLPRRDLVRLASMMQWLELAQNEI